MSRTDELLAAWSSQFDRAPVGLAHTAEDALELAAVVPPEQRPRLADYPPLLTLDDAADVLGLDHWTAFLMYRRRMLPFEVTKTYRSFTVLRDDLAAALRSGSLATKPGEGQ